jgi:hypothetical protein
MSIIRRCGIFGLVGVSVCLGAAALAEKTPLSVALPSAGYELVSSKDGVRVFQDRNSDDIRIAGEAELPAPPAAVREVLLDYDRHAGFVPRLADSRVLSRGLDSLLVYQRLRLPIVSDRDFTLRVRWGAEAQVLWIVYEGLRVGGPPPVDGVVRVSVHSGSWQLKPIGNGKTTFARYQTRIDLAGWMPKWLARSRAANDVPGLFAAIRRMLIAARSR